MPQYVHSLHIEAMFTFTLLCLVAFVSLLNCGYSVAGNDGCQKTTNSLVLKKHLFCSYDPTVRPVKEHTNTTNVSLYLILKSLIFNEHHNSLEVHSWTLWFWDDEHLKWDKNDFGGLPDIKIPTSDLWTPDVSIFNAGSMDVTGTAIEDSYCSITFKGSVTCVSQTVFLAQCTPNIRRWPFDSHTCSIRVGSWTHTGAELNLSIPIDKINIAQYDKNREWELVHNEANMVTNTYKNKTYQWVVYQFELKRHSGSHAAAMVTPAILLAVVTLVTFWVAPEDVYRLGLISVNIVCHCIYMIFLAVMLPSNGDQTPIIVTFFRDSFLLLGVSLLVTLCTARMTTTVSAPPSWITTITHAILAVPPGQLLLLGEQDPKGQTSAREKGPNETETGGAEDWRLFASLLDRVFFLVFLIALFILLCAYIP